VKFSNRRSRLRIAFDGEGMTSHAGAALLVEFADRAGLTDGLSDAMRGTCRRKPQHDRALVLRDLAIVLAAGGDCVSDLGALKGREEVFGAVPSIPTAWRTLRAMGALQSAGVSVARARAREHLWSSAGAPEGDLTLDFDATLVDSHSEKEGAAATWKHGFGFHPLVCYLDETGEPLAGMLRPGNAGSDTAVDHIEVLHRALAQLPSWAREDRRILARADAGGATHAFARVLREGEIRFSFGYFVKAGVRNAIWAVPEEEWTVALTQDCGEDEDAHVCELTSRLDLRKWPSGTRAICRRERRHPGAQANLPGMEDYRFVVFITDQDEPDIRLLEVEYRRRAHVEDGIRCAKNLGLRAFPSAWFQFNQAWLDLLMTGQCLLIWFQQTCLTGAARWWEPKTTRFRLLNVCGRIVRSGRRVTLRLPRDWPWRNDLAQAVRQVRLMPAAP
jgi:hypothetical protein